MLRAIVGSSERMGVLLVCCQRLGQQVGEHPAIDVVETGVGGQLIPGGTGEHHPVGDPDPALLDEGVPA